MSSLIDGSCNSSSGSRSTAGKSPLPLPSRTTLPKLIVGNWKPSPSSEPQAKALAALLAASDVADRRIRGEGAAAADVLVFAPSMLLPAMKRELDGTAVQLGAQDGPSETGGGGGTADYPYVMVGHSESRTELGDADAHVHDKLRAALDAGLKVVLCVGEGKEEYKDHQTESVCALQLGAALQGVSASEVSASVTIAYEPVWAMGGPGPGATPAIAQFTHACIRRWLSSEYSEEVSQSVRLLVADPSISPSTAASHLTCPDIDGLVVTGGSLSAASLLRIASAAKEGRDGTHCHPHSGTCGAGERARKTRLRAIPRLWPRKLVACRNELGESPIWSSERNLLAWVDIPGKQLWEFDAGKGTSRHFSLPEVVGCCAFRRGGGYILGLKNGLTRFDPATGNLDRIGKGKGMMAFEPGLPTRPNDGRVASRDGSLIFGSYNEKHKVDGASVAGLYRFKPNGEVLEEILEHRFRVSNCISFSPGGDVMYFTDSPTRQISAFDYSEDSPALSNRRLVYEMPPSMEGSPDGACVDASGHLWVAFPGAGVVLCIDPEGGELLMEVPVPCSMPTSCTIGGPELNILFITTRAPDGGELFSVQLPDGVVGVSEPSVGEEEPVGGHPFSHDSFPIPS